MLCWTHTKGDPAVPLALLHLLLPIPSNVCLASWNLAEQVLPLKAHLYVKLNRYRPLIHTLDWEKSRQKWKKKKKGTGRNTDGWSCSSNYTVCMQHAGLTSSSTLIKQAWKASHCAPNWRKSLLCCGSPETARHKWCINWEQARLPRAQIYSFEVTGTPVKCGGELTALPCCWVAGGMLS